MDLSSKSLIAERNLSFFGDSILWLKQGSVVKAADGSLADLVIGSFKGDIVYYSLSSDSLWPQTGSAPGLNDIFYDCGTRCFYMRRHTMNYTDILEVPNPLLTAPNKATIELESAIAEFNPIYNDDASTLYYSAKTETAAAIIEHRLDQAARTLHSLLTLGACRT